MMMSVDNSVISLGRIPKCTQKCIVILLTTTNRINCKVITTNQLKQTTLCIILLSSSRHVITINCNSSSCRYMEQSGTTFIVNEQELTI